MSEPVIKADGYQCPKCRHMAVENMRGGPWLHCTLCDVDTVALYGPDGLVRAVAFTISETSSMSPLDVQSFAENTVDRLTKGDV